MKKAEVLCVLFLLCLGTQALAEETESQAAAVGELFGVEVPAENYYFAKGALEVFGARDGRQFKDDAEKEDYLWEQLLLSFEAFRREVVVSDEELATEINKILRAENAGFDRKSDPAAYADWVKERVNEPAELFENQLRYLMQIEKLKDQVRESIVPEVSEQEMFEEFLNEHHTLEIEIAEFKEQKEAEEFYRRAKRAPGLWEKEKARQPKKFRRPGFVSLEFLIDLWKVPQEAAYAMMKSAPGEMYPASPIYEGWGVFKVIRQRPADESLFAKQKDSYYNQIKRRKQFEGLGKWLEGLKEQAKITVYQKGGGQ